MSNHFLRKAFSFLSILLSVSATVSVAQKPVPQINATSGQALILDGDEVKIPWKLDPNARPDSYYVNVPHRESIVTLRTDAGEWSVKTKYGQTYDLLVLLNGKDSCLVRIVAKEEPTPVLFQWTEALPQTIPFTLTGSRIYLQGKLNGQENVTVQFDLGAGGTVVNQLSSEKLKLAFTGKAMVDNSQGVNEARLSAGNDLALGGLTWSGVPIVEVGNMKPYEDLIIGNGFFRDKVIEIDYDKKVLIVHHHLPAKAKSFKKQPVYYEQNRPRFKAAFVQNGKKYSFWFLFDTGREGAMLIGEDFTREDNHWEDLKELQIINGKKIIRLNAIIAGTEFKDIVTNAADPSKPAGRPSLFGNQILNHFNVILDNRNGFIYLKPNGRANAPYFNYESYLKERAKP